ncbi:hypothetical protein VNO78_11224 [Psophocarpus tetragonolobus]|uniref:Uncharacterized protein n=1 Tax=Psophocarpus tetragonolobus TaxID=3891 RepID=A0AAN9SNU4_PSOTE
MDIGDANKCSRWMLTKIAFLHHAARVCMLGHNPSPHSLLKLHSLCYKLVYGLHEVRLLPQSLLQSLISDDFDEIDDKTTTSRLIGKSFSRPRDFNAMGNKMKRNVSSHQTKLDEAYEA